MRYQTQHRIERITAHDAAHGAPWAAGTLVRSMVVTNADMAHELDMFGEMDVYDAGMVTYHAYYSGRATTR